MFQLHRPHLHLFLECSHLPFFFLSWILSFSQEVRERFRCNGEKRGALLFIKVLLFLLSSLSLSLLYKHNGAVKMLLID
ncbi:hypothetical protein CARUB_v10015279mg [Capsella rubella]|uniref:Uncharacterized protein n=1 Tax=Capsella rubella TaxID=81985 RepID=R0I2C8_9BRAS|nr:hypothetical protein CARUB_v10015279mg [Capsella rubella]